MAQGLKGQTLRLDPGSYRDPAGRVLVTDCSAFRVIERRSESWLAAVWDTGIVERLAQRGRLIETRRADDEKARLGPAAEGAVAILEHRLLPLVSYPYEWCFRMLQAAALAHLDLHLEILNEGFTLSDATAFNMQFRGVRPVHIDVLSIVPYAEGERFAGYGQFQRQFLNPLVLEATTGVSFAPYYRGTLDGIGAKETWRLLPARKRLKPAYWMHIGLPARADRALVQEPAVDRRAFAALPKAKLIALLQHLRMTIAGLAPPSRSSFWADYNDQCTYSADETHAKAATIEAFCRRIRPDTIVDLGCNTGFYSEIALRNGARRVIGIESDRTTADRAFERAVKSDLDLLPLTIDIANPSPAQGWRNSERESLQSRLRADGLLALAVLHHLCIARNVPMASAVEHLVSLAPRGVIEFVPKDDPQVSRLLRYRSDIFPDYTIDAFRRSLADIARVEEERTVTASGRTVFVYKTCN